MYGADACAAALAPPASAAAAAFDAAEGGSHLAEGPSEEEAEAAAVRRAALVVEWWGEVNMQAYRWAKAHLAPSGRYHLLRVEDLAVADPHTEVGTTQGPQHWQGHRVSPILPLSSRSITSHLSTP